MSEITRSGEAVVIRLADHRRARGGGRNDLWIAALAIGALLAILLGLSRPFARHARAADDPDVPALAE
jgi:hypothetical protein